MANAVADDPERHYGDGDIAWLLNSRLGGYLVTGKEDDITVYRLSMTQCESSCGNAGVTY